jgi:hypothetical protein
MHTYAPILNLIGVPPCYFELAIVLSRYDRIIESFSVSC